MRILHLQERPRVRLFVRRDPYGRFLSCLVFVPRDRYNTDLRERMQAILREAVNAFEVDFNVSLAESPLARIHFIARTRPEDVPAFEIGDIEARLAEATRSWADRLHEALIEAHGEEAGNDLLRRYRASFPAAYREDYTARHAVHDIGRIEAALKSGAIELHLAQAGDLADDLLVFKLYHPAVSVTLSDVLPMLENMGVTVLDDRPYEIRMAGGSVWIHAFRLRHNEAESLDTDQVRATFQEAFALVWAGVIDNDGFNRLVLRARLDAYEILVLRAYARYLRQIGLTYSQAYIEDCLAGYPDTARALVGLFDARFDPRRKARAARVSALAAQIEEALEATTSLDEDRILRGLLSVIQATLRTNWFQRGPNGERKFHLALKLDPGLIPNLPRPIPMFEAFVCSADVEAVHLRGGHVARGGIRWSDRREDFRTEVLGLMKAQRVKNVVIVPVGAKGGFIVKRPPVAGGREALHQMGVHCYRTFIRGLLDVTDNRVGQRIVPPPQTVRYDGDDPYLVVAADKGTATFSDIANALALQHGFWLGDGFASGGSAGYDHKKMGITARGAFEAVKHHFADLGVDIERHPFTVVGIGDMGGDVFGNGMLLSRHIQLVGAFNHQHIFLDPNPDPEASFGERRRLFDRPTCTWADYDPALISPGGGVWPRSAKSIPIWAEARAVLGIENKSLLPSDLIRALLKAPVDLLWNGGIGTFVKSSGESHAEVGDRTNDGIRVDGRDLRCKVVGEGGNLGLTQRARIEYALAGGRINTDSIDNCAGVNCSDHEVNIKILLNAAVTEGDLTGKQRDVLIAEMTDEVGALVVQDSYRLARALTVAELDAERHLGWYMRLMGELEQKGILERALEFLPDDATLAERKAAGRGLTRPELSVLSAYARMDLYTEVLRSDMPDDPYLIGVLERYFPEPLRKRFQKEILGHRLRREIIATVATNSMLNRVGSTFGLRMRELSGMPLPAIAKAYLAARDIFQVRGLWDELDQTEARVSRAARVIVVRETQTLIERGTRWLLQRSPEPFEITDLVSRFLPAVEALGAVLPGLLATAPASQSGMDAEWFRQEGVGEGLATRLAGLRRLICALDLGELAERTGIDLAVAGRVYFEIERRLSIDVLRERIAQGEADFWQERARTNLEDELGALGAALTAAALVSEADPERLKAMVPKTVVERWAGSHGAAIERYDHLRDELTPLEAPGLPMLTVALGELRGLARCPSALPAAAPSPPP
ncbi:MAG: NAD-glutamate dehydrogenase [Gammaproteobacteria bacterium]